MYSEEFVSMLGLFIVFVFIFFVIALVIGVLGLVARVRLLRRMERSSWYVLVPFIVEVLVVSESNLDDKERSTMYNYIWIMMIVLLVSLFSSLIPLVGGLISVVLSIAMLVFYIIYPIKLNKSFANSNGNAPSLALPILSAIFLGDSLVYYGLSKNILINNRDLDFKFGKYRALGFVIFGIASFTIVMLVILVGVSIAVGF